MAKSGSCPGGCLPPPQLPPRKRPGRSLPGLGSAGGPCSGAGAWGDPDPLPFTAFLIERLSRSVKNSWQPCSSLYVPTLVVLGFAMAGLFLFASLVPVVSCSACVIRLEPLPGIVIEDFSVGHGPCVQCDGTLKVPLLDHWNRNSGRVR